MLETVSVTDAREGFGELIDRVHYTKSRTAVTKHGKRIAAIVPFEDLELLLELEARIDLDEARAALEEAREKGTVSWEELKEELDL